MHVCTYLHFFAPHRTVLLDLPQELLVVVCSRLSIAEMKHMSHVCKQFNHLWKDVEFHVTWLKSKHGAHMALLKALRHGWSPELVARLLADPGINVNAPHGVTALYLACHVCLEGHTAVVELLLAVENINVNAQIVNGYTALHVASIKKHTEVVELLLACGEHQCERARW